ncbi:MAG: lysophospholipid acyltransferase family protein [Prevotellaceae bacterium]|nr:lysophospholipid acyltransferase family protein [Prevotellaceae bacterium]
MYLLLLGVVWVVALLPLRILYWFSDITYLIVYHLIKYRHKIVSQNLRNSFPEKSEKELRVIERKFYRFFCDIFFEAIKKMHISEKQMRKRFEYINQEAVIQQLNAGQSIVLMTAHFGNWEWFATFTVHIHGRFTVAQIYQRLHSQSFDRLMLALRSKFGVLNIERKDLLRTLVKMRLSKSPAIYGFLSDQSPNSRDSEKLGLQFLNQKTPVLLGAEKVAQRFDYPVFYGKISRKKRGYYSCEFVPVTLKPSELSPREITVKFMNLLQTDIRRQPELWLWTHKRWKHAEKIKNFV